MIIKTDSLTKHYQVGSEKVEALKGISFSVEKGEFISIMGPSGSGKTTLMHLLPRFYDPSSGSISIDGQDIRNVTLSSLRNIPVRAILRRAFRLDGHRLHLSDRMVTLTIVW